MKQKIEWYREVLVLEPGSRVFFPLAKLLASDNQTQEAVSTLQQGLLRHPDHVEARLLLVELLYMHNDEQSLQNEIENLGSIFSLYPGFWRAWSEKLANTPAFHDAALAMLFFSAALQGKTVSWAGIIEQGLQAMLREGEEAFVSPAFAPHIQSVQEAAAMQQSVPLPAPPHLPEQDVEPPDDSVISEDSPPPPLAEVHQTLPDAEEEDSEEAFSLRTRSMAEVLAEQGDIAGALDIYQELMLNASDEEKTSLSARAEELSVRMNVTSSSETKNEDKAPAPGGESTRLVSLLESLAQRLEARAR